MKNLKGIKVLNENEMKTVTGGDTSLPINARKTIDITKVSPVM